MTLFDPQSHPSPITIGDQVVLCDRCGVHLRFRPQTGNAGARVMRHARQPKGVCATCGFRQWLATDYGGALEEIIRRDCKNDPIVLKSPHIREMIQRLMIVGKCDAPFEEIDFDRLVAQWDLPIAGKRKGR
jgi:hypothetical protein